jgi:4-amino-4-deoxy-L-arabinose transferase-like glycosyltransferase
VKLVDLRQGKTLAALVFIIALLARAVVAQHFASESVWDGHYYDFYAHRIAYGFGYSDPMLQGGVDVGRASCHYPVGYSAALGLFYAVLGHARSTSAFFNALVGAGVAGLVTLWCERDLGRLRSFLAGLFVALHPGLVLFSALTMSENLSALGTISAFFAAVRLRNEPRLVVRIAVPALLLGLSALVRPPALFVLPFVLPYDALVRAWKASNHKRAVGIVAATALFTLLPILPWTARNCARMDGCALVSTNGGWNLAIGAFPRATGRFEGLRAEDGCREVTGQVQQDRCWLGVGLAHIRSTPGRWLGLIPKKWSHTFDHESFQVEYLHEADPARWPDARRSAARALLTGAHWLLCVAAALTSLRRFPLRAWQAHRTNLAGACLMALVAWFGLSRSAETIWPCLLLGLAIAAVQTLRRKKLANRHTTIVELQAWGLVASVFFTHAVFFGEDRYHIVASPVLCVLAACIGRRDDEVPSTT